MMLCLALAMEVLVERERASDGFLGVIAGGTGVLFGLGGGLVLAIGVAAWLASNAAKRRLKQQDS